MSLRLLHVSAEVAPFARTGGLGDAVMGLGKALAAPHAGSDAGDDVVLVTPRYGTSKQHEQAIAWREPLRVRVGARTLQVGVRELWCTPRSVGVGHSEPGLRVLFIEHDGLFGGRQGLYGDAFGDFGDNPLRFAVLSAAALEASARLWPDRGHDRLHAHDWHAALSILYARIDPRFRLHRSLLTVHNLAHQGVLAPSQCAALGLPEHWLSHEVLLQNGALNLLKGAIALADRVTTVSPQYAREILTPAGGFGLDPHLAYHRDKLSGIVNGVDTSVYNPETDAALPRRYGAHDSALGKAAARSAAQHALGLAQQPGPLFSVISRFDAQKGLDVFFRVVPELLRWGGQVAILGQGAPELTSAAERLAARFAGQVGLRTAFDDQLARWLYAGGDFVMVPSRFEPCGLSQLYAMRYGAAPIVSRTGGLLDTVQPIDEVSLDAPTALTAQGFARGPGWLVDVGDAYGLLDACLQAIELQRDGHRMQRLRERLMASDFSWARAADHYAALYRGCS